MAGNTARLNLGILAALFVGLLGLAALSESFGQVDASATQPKVAAFFTEKDKLQVAVFVDDRGPKPAEGSLLVQVVDGAGAKIFSNNVRSVTQHWSVGSFLFSIIPP